jgi:hypothetical protein
MWPTSRAAAVLGLAVGWLVVFMPARASAQGAGYVPYGTLSGGFVPYRPGPSGGFTMTNRPVGTTPLGSGGFESMAGAMRPALGAGRSTIGPLAPVRLNSNGMGVGGLLGRGSSSMKPTARPPVGGYPFRVPPSLTGPGGPAMPM